MEDDSDERSNGKFIYAGVGICGGAAAAAGAVVGSSLILSVGAATAAIGIVGYIMEDKQNGKKKK